MTDSNAQSVPAYDSQMAILLHAICQQRQQQQLASAAAALGCGVDEGGTQGHEDDILSRAGLAMSPRVPGPVRLAAVAVPSAASHPSIDSQAYFALLRRHEAASMSGGSQSHSQPAYGSAANCQDHQVSSTPQQEGSSSSESSAPQSHDKKLPQEESGRILVALSSDSGMLSEYQCYLRKQIYFFEAGISDLEASAQGRNKPIKLGQVGILCRHCSHLEQRSRTSGAVYFPSKLRYIYQASQNLAAKHFKSCPVRSWLFRSTAVYNYTQCPCKN